MGLLRSAAGSLARAPRLRAAVLAVALAGLLGGAVLGGRVLEAAVLCVVAALAAVEALIVAGLMRRLRDAARNRTRERLLRRAGVACLAAGDVAELPVLVARALDAMPGGLRAIAVAGRPVPGRPTPADVAGGGVIFLPPELHDLVGAEPLSWPPEHGADVAPLLRDGAGAAVAIGLRFGDDLAGIVVASHQGPLDPEDRRWLEAFAGQLVLAVGALEARTVTSRRRATEKFRTLVQRTGALVALVSEQGDIVWISDNVEDQLGYATHELLGMPVASLVAWQIAEPDRIRTLEAFEQARADAADAPTVVTVRIRDKQGEERWVDMSLTNMLHDDSVRAIVLQTRDVSARVALEQEARKRRRTDALTQLPNRADLEDRLSSDARADDEDTVVAVIDLDDFGRINETMGHEAGDALLLAVSRRLVASIGPDALLGRLNADEFACIVRGQDDAAVVALVRRGLEVLGDPFEVMGEPVRVTASGGIARGGAHVRTSGTLLRNADLALQHALRDGPGSIGVFVPEMLATALERRRLAEDLPAGIDEGQLELHFQPIVAADTHAWVAAEALVRWRHPTLGMVSPDRFVAVAEETGHVVALGDWVLATACDTVAAWRRRGLVGEDFRVGVNVSGVELARPDLTDRVRGALDRSGLPATALTVEVTETAMTNVAEARGHLEALRDLGVAIAIDDFGTGHSSLAYLKDLPATTLKVPRPFVQELDPEGRGGAIVAGVVALARSLGLTPLAEGVETRWQAEAVAAAGCERLQGFLFSRPLPPAEFVALAAAQGGVHASR